ncbi:MAG: cytidylate kinase family protein [Atribacterota bacterium]
MDYPIIITISRETESLGDEIALRLAEVLGFELVDRESVSSLLLSSGYEDLPESIDKEKFLSWAISVRDVVVKRAHHRPVVFLGRGGQKIFESEPDAFHVLIITSPEMRLQRTMEKYRQDEVTASHILVELDRKREKFLLETMGANWKDPVMYHLVLNTAFYPVERACETIMEAMKNVVVPVRHAEQPTLFENLDFGGKKVDFVHPSEEEFARILDFYGIRWLYEPRQFPLEWDNEGNVIEAFSPDFYLLDFDLFIELTTQKQKLVWRKNRKVRRLRELYPQVKIKVIYSRDYTHLLRKFGVEDNQ